MTHAYGSVLAEAYDAFVASDGRDDIDAWIALARASDDPVLELGCGTGRLLLPLAAAGIDVEGLDAAPAMLAVCRREAASRGLSVTLHEADMSDFSLPRRFGFVFCAAGSLSLLAEPGVLERALGAIRRACRPGARVAFELDAPTPPRPTGEERIVRDLVRPADGARLLCRLLAVPDPDPQVRRYLMTTEIRPVGGAPRVEETPIAFRMLDPETITALLAQAGFEAVAIGPAPGAPGDAVDEAFLVTARAPTATIRAFEEAA
jgi:SAM-dependent methyltransferase